MDLAKENPVLAGIVTFGAFMFLSKIFGSGNKGLFNSATAKAGGAGLAMSIISAVMGDKVQDIVPDFVEEYIPGLD